jgi:HEAT repeat protein
MRCYLFLPLAALALALVPGLARAADKDDLMADQLKLKGSYLGTDGPSLVSFLRTRAKGEVTRERLEELLKDLEGTDLTKRQKAAAELVAIGTPAIPMLRLAARDIDNPDYCNQAKACLRAIEEDPGALSSAAVRLLAAARPEGTAQALLDFLPHAETDAVLEEIQGLLISVAYEKGKANPVLMKALSDKTPLRRAVAVTALCAGGIPEPRATFRALLRDPKASVRLRAALALAKASDPKAVSTLITLLPDLPIEQAREIEGHLQELAGELAPKAALGEDTLSREKARDAWARWWLDTEGDGLINELTKRTLSEKELAEINSLIEKLGDDSFEVRQESEDKLKKMGAKIIPLLRNAKNHSDLEIRNRSQKCLESIEMDKTPPLSVVTVRLLALRKPKTGAAAIIAYMPFADDETMVDELQTSLNVMAHFGGKADPAVVKAITDKYPARRAAAAQALCAGPLAPYMKEIRKALADKDMFVRSRTALALAAAKEAEAVPVLIDLVGEGPEEASTAAEEYLVKLARDAGPKDLPEGDDARKKRSAAWKKWWEDNKAKVVMVDRYSPSMRQPYLGYTMLVENNNNQIRELDKNNKPRWTITGLLSPWDVQYLPGNKLLVTEYNGQRVTERDLKGKILWTATVPTWPMSAERLRNGRTFITCRNMLIEVDRKGKQVFKIDRPHDVYSARRLPNGKIVLITTNRAVVTFDKSGKELKSFMLPNVMYYQNEILDNGNVLIPLGWQNRVAEYDQKGKEVWSTTTVMQPSHAVRLPNGHTLVTSQNWPNKVYEIDKKGTKAISEYVTNTYVFRSRRR